jgi:hypothetical protein
MKDVERKLGRAEHHGADLANLLKRYRDGKPYRVGQRTDEWRGVAYKVHYAEGLGSAPDEAPLTFGDIV